MRIINKQKLELLKQKEGVKIKKIKKIELDSLSTTQIHQLFEGKNLIDRIRLLYFIVKSIGNPFELLGNNLDKLRCFGIDDDIIEIIACHIVYTKVLSDRGNIANWKKEIKIHEESLKSAIVYSDAKIKKELEIEIQNLNGRINSDFLTDLIGSLSEILPIESNTDKYIFISELLRELGIKKKEPYQLLKEAEDDFERAFSSQTGRKAIYIRIKNDKKNYDEMLENTIELID